MILLRYRVRHALAASLLAALTGALMSAPESAAAQQPTLTLTLGGAARLATERSAGTEIARSRMDQADARLRQRRAEFLPSIMAAVGESEHTFNSASFGISFADPVSGKSLFNPNGQVLGPVKIWDVRGTLRQSVFDPGAFARMRASRASASAIGTEANGAAQQAASLAAASYVRALRADAQWLARIADSTLAAELLSIARDQLAAGMGIALDVTRARSQLSAAHSQLIAARIERDRARLDLVRALNLPLGTVVALGDSLRASPANGELPSIAEALDRATRTRADLKTIGEQITAAERQLDAVRAENLPSLSAFADHGPTGGSPNHLLGTYAWGLQISVPVFDGFKRDGRMDEQRASIRELDARRREITQQAAADVSAALLDLGAAGEQLAAADERFGLAEQELAQARDRFRAGVSGNADVIAASLGLNAARTQVVDARAGVLAARVSLHRAQGNVTDLP